MWAGAALGLFECGGGEGGVSEFCRVIQGPGIEVAELLRHLYTGLYWTTEENNLA